MQVFVPNNNLSESAKILDDLRLNKQIVENVQLLVLYYNKKKYPTTRLGHENHPVAKQYDNDNGYKLLFDYTLSLCEESEHRFKKVHTSYFTLLGLKDFFVYSNENKSNEYDTYYIKGQVNKDQVITNNNVNQLYIALLQKKWCAVGKSPSWTNREIPKEYKVIHKLSTTC